MGRNPVLNLFYNGFSVYVFTSPFSVGDGILGNGSIPALLTIWDALTEGGIADFARPLLKGSCCRFPVSTLKPVMPLLIVSLWLDDSVRANEENFVSENFNR